MDDGAIDQMCSVLTTLKSGKQRDHPAISTEAVGLLKVFSMWLSQEIEKHPRRTFDEWVEASIEHLKTLLPEKNSTPLQKLASVPPPQPPPLPPAGAPPPPPMPKGSKPIESADSFKPSLSYVSNDRVPRILLIPSFKQTSTNNVFSALNLEIARRVIDESTFCSKFCRRINATSVGNRQNQSKLQRSLIIAEAKPSIIDAHRMTMVGIFRSKLHPNTFPELLKALPRLSAAQLTELARCLPTENERDRLGYFFNAPPKDEGFRSPQEEYPDEWFMWQAARVHGLLWMISATAFLADLAERTAVLKKHLLRLRSSMDQVCESQELVFILSCLWRLWELANCRYGGKTGGAEARIAGLRVEALGRIPQESPWIGEALILLIPGIATALYLDLFSAKHQDQADASDLHLDILFDPTEMSKTVQCVEPLKVDWDLPTCTEEWKDLQEGLEMIKQGPSPLSTKHDDYLDKESAFRFHKHIPIAAVIEPRLESIARLYQRVSDAWARLQQYLAISTDNPDNISPKGILASLYTFVSWLVELENKSDPFVL